MLITILKLPLRLLAIPLAMILCTIHLLGEMVFALASGPAAVVMFVLLAVGIYWAWYGNWCYVGLAFAGEVILTTVQLGFLAIVDKIAEWSAEVLAFAFT